MLVFYVYSIWSEYLHMDLFGGQEGMVWEVVNRLAYAMERRDAVL